MWFAEVGEFSQFESQDSEVFAEDYSFFMLMTVVVELRGSIILFVKKEVSLQ